MGFDPYNHSLKIRDSNSQSGSSLGSVRVHSLTLSYTPGSIRCDSRASFLAHTLTSLCLGGEPKTKVATTNPWICVPMFFYNIMSVYRWRMFAISINLTICYYCMPMLHTKYLPSFGVILQYKSYFISDFQQQFALKCFPPIYGGRSIVGIKITSMIFF
jgi:hypothetical protein